MIETRSQLMNKIAGLAIVLVCASGQLSAQNFDDAMTRGAGALDAGNWHAAVDEFQKADEILADPTNYQKGALLYHRGYALLKRGMELIANNKKSEGRKDLMKALEILEQCSSLAGEDEDANVYKKRALLYQGAVHQGLEQYDRALTLYEQFLLERNQLRDHYEQDVMLVNLAICCSLKEVPDFGRARKFFEDALSNRERRNTPGSQLVRSLNALLIAYGKAGKEDELIGLVRENRDSLGKLCGESIDLQGQFTSLASRATQARLYRASNALLNLLSFAGKFWVELGGSVRLLDSFERDLVVENVQAGALELYAYNTEMQGRLGESKSAYQLLLGKSGDASSRENYILHLVRLCHTMRDDEQTVLLGEAFLSELKNKAIARSVRQFVADSLLQLGEYDRVLELYRDSGELMNDLNADELFMMIRAAFLGSHFTEVLNLEDIYVERGVKGEHVQEVGYYKLSSLVRLRSWEEAAKEAENILSRDVGASDEFVSLVKYEQAQVKFALDQVNAAESILKSLLTGADEKVVALSYNLLGNIQQATREREKAQHSYEEALKIARKINEEPLVQESLFYLVALLGQEEIDGFKNDELKKALPYFDAFFEKYVSSEYAAQVLVAGMAAMREADRFDEYAVLFQQVIPKMAERENTPGLELAVDAYLWVLQEQGRTFSEVRKYLLQGHPPVRLMAVFKDALARACWRFEDKAERGKDAARSSLNDLRKRVLMLDIRSDYRLSDFPPYVMLNLANYLVSETGSPEEALPYYEAVMVRGTVAEGIEAKYGMARILQASGMQADLPRVEELLGDVVARSTDPALTDSALALLIEVLAGKGEWAVVAEKARLYLENKGHDNNRARVSLLLAKSYDSRGMKEDAIVTYGQVYANYLNSLEVSAPAVDRLSTITWERNKPGDGPANADRQIAYQLAHRYLSLTRESFEAGKQGLSEETREAWGRIERNVDQWEKSGQIKTVEQLLDDRRKGKKSF